MFHILPKQCHQLGYLYLRHETVGDTETLQIETLQFGKLLFWFCFVFFFTKNILSFRNSGESSCFGFLLMHDWCLVSVNVSELNKDFDLSCPVLERKQEVLKASLQRPFPNGSRDLLLFLLLAVPY